MITIPSSPVLFFKLPAFSQIPLNLRTMDHHPGMGWSLDWDSQTPVNTAESKNIASLYIRRDQLFSLYSAILFSNYQGYILNFEMTISWSLAGINCPNSVNNAYNTLMGRFRKFMSWRRIPSFYYSVFESGDKIGYHTHFALHIPDDLRDEFRELIKNFTNHICGDEHQRGIIHTHAHKENSIDSQWIWFQYCMKGLDPTLMVTEKKLTGANDLNTLAGVRRQETGYVEIQRVRIARALGYAARKKAKYIPQHDLIDYDKRYSDLELKRGHEERAGKGAENS